LLTEESRFIHYWYDDSNCWIQSIFLTQNYVYNNLNRPQASRIQCIIKVSGLPRLDSSQQSSMNTTAPISYRSTGISANGGSNISTSTQHSLVFGGASTDDSYHNHHPALTPRHSFSASVRDSLSQLPMSDSAHVAQSNSARDSAYESGNASAAGDQTPTLFMAAGNKLSVLPLRFRRRATEVSSFRLVLSF
jgi:hypothetical protein